MTSEIRTNSLKSRAGLSTVTLTDSGPMFSGITTFVDNSTFSVGTGGTIHAPATNTLNIGVNNTESIRIDSNSNLKVAGIVTATHFHGDGSNLTGISGVTINNNADNRLITGSGSANTLNGESGLTFDNTNLLLDGKILKFANVSSTPSASGNVHIYGHDTKLKMCGGSGIQFEEGGFTRWHITSGALHPHGTTYNNLGNSSNRVGNAYIQTSVDLIDGAELRLGSDDDLKIYHNGSNGYLKNSTGQQLYRSGTHTFENAAGSTEYLRIDSSGNLMINRTSASKKFSIRESSTSSGVYFCQTVGGSSHLTNYAVGIGFDPEGYPARNKIAIVAEGVGAGYSKGKLHFLVNDAANSSEATLSDAAMTIYETGQVGINRDTTPLNGVKLMVQNPSNNVFYAYHEGTGNNYTFLCRNDRAVSSTQATQIIFLGSGNTYVGDIKSNGSSTSYNTSSDYRLKENVTTISDGITRIKTLKPCRFNFISNPSQTVDGFLAHEVTAVPEAISGTKDEVVTQAMIDSGDAPSDSKLDDPIYQQIDQAKLVPLLTAALQEAITKIETIEQDNIALRARVTNLEGN